MCGGALTIGSVAGLSVAAGVAGGLSVGLSQAGLFVSRKCVRYSQVHKEKQSLYPMSSWKAAAHKIVAWAILSFGGLLGTASAGVLGAGTLSATAVSALFTFSYLADHTAGFAALTLGSLSFAAFGALGVACAAAAVWQGYKILKDVKQQAVNLKQ